MFYNIKLCSNQDYDGILSFVVLAHRDKWVVLLIKPYANNKVV